MTFCFSLLDQNGHHVCSYMVKTLKKYSSLERSTWRSGVRSAMRAASQLPGKGPTDVDDAPASAR